MGRMNNLMYDIADYLREGHMSFFEIAQRLEIPVSWVVEVAGMMANED